MVLVAVPGTRARVPARGDPEHTGVHGPVCLQTEHSRPKIHNASSLSSQRGFQRLAPRLVAGVHDVDQPVLASPAGSCGKSSRVKVMRNLTRSRVAFPAEHKFTIVQFGLRPDVFKHHIRVCDCLLAQFAFFNHTDSGVHVLLSTINAQVSTSTFSINQSSKNITRNQAAPSSRVSSPQDDPHNCFNKLQTLENFACPS